MKRVLVADRTTLGTYVSSADANLAAYAIAEAQRRRDAGMAPALLARVADRRSERLSAQAASALESTGGQGVHGALRRTLADNRAAVRAAAALVVARFGDRAAIPALREGLDRPDTRTRIAAASFLAGFRDRRAEPRIIRLVDELNRVDRRLLCNPLGRFGDAASRRKLLSMLAHESYAGTRARAALALGARGNRSAVRGLVAALKDHAADVRYAAAKALGAIGDRSALPALQAASAGALPPSARAWGMEARARAAAAEAVDILTGKRVGPEHAPADLSRWSDTSEPERRLRSLDYSRQPLERTRNGRDRQ